MCYVSPVLSTGRFMAVLWVFMATVFSLYKGTFIYFELGLPVFFNGKFETFMIKFLRSATSECIPNGDLFPSLFLQSVLIFYPPLEIFVSPFQRRPRSNSVTVSQSTIRYVWKFFLFVTIARNKKRKMTKYSPEISISMRTNIWKGTNVVNFHLPSRDYIC